MVRRWAREGEWKQPGRSRLCAVSVERHEASSCSRRRVEVEKVEEEEEEEEEEDDSAQQRRQPLPPSLLLPQSQQLWLCHLLSCCLQLGRFCTAVV